MNVPTHSITPYPNVSSSLEPIPTHHAPSLPHHPFPRRVGQPTAHRQRRAQQRCRLILLVPSRTDSNTTCSCSVAIGLIDIQTVDHPGSVCESRGVVLHVIVAAIGKGGAVGAIAPNISGPVAAEVCIQDLVGCGSISGLVVARRKRG